MDTGLIARHTNTTRRLFVTAALIAALLLSGCGGTDEAAPPHEDARASEVSVSPDGPTDTSGAEPASKGPADYTDPELAAIARSLIEKSEVTNPEWEQHIQQRFTGPGVQPWIDGRHEAIAEVGLTTARALAQASVTAEVIERGEQVGSTADVAKVRVLLTHPQADGVSKLDVRMLFQDGVWKIRVPQPGLIPQGVNR